MLESSDPSLSPVTPVIASEAQRLLTALKQGDETAFENLVAQYHSAMVRVALIYVNDRRLAEEVVQETWIGVLRGLENFAGRSSFKTWIFSILINQAKTLAQREGRYIQFSALTEEADEEPAVPPEYFEPKENEQWAGHWISIPRNWNEIPENKLVAHETLTYIQKAIEKLPANQREVITLRDMEQWSAAEVCNALDISETNQRVLLHRARSKVRRALEQYLEATGQL
jgi:RNA polymerase sigma-70 factor, ECF subfamily